MSIGPERLFDMPSERLTLADRFLVPPFTVLDARGGYWRERKQQWLRLGLEGEVGRDGNLLGLSEAERRQAVEGDAYPEGRGAGKAAAEQRSRLDEALGAPLGGEGRDAQVLPPATGTGKAASSHMGYGTRTDWQHGLSSGDGRGDRLLSSATPREGYGGDYDLANSENAWGGAGTSIFDPVLCELLYRWFSPPGGAVLDPFAGGSVRGIVAAMVERHYVGVDLRPEQVEANERQRELLQSNWSEGYWPRWECGDSRDLVRPSSSERGEYDMVFTCPPYYDLEVYSDDPRDLSAADTYEEFRVAYRDIIAGAAERLHNDRFAAFVVGDVRGPDGTYLGLPHDTISAFRDAGLRLYNQAVLVTPVGSLPIRTARTFPPGRKLGMGHQQVLVFVKGDGRAAANACGPIGEVALEQGGAAMRMEVEA